MLFDKKGIEWEFIVKLLVIIIVLVFVILLSVGLKDKMIDLFDFIRV